MAKFNYLGFSLLLLFIGLSFFVIFSEPHNLMGLQNESKFDYKGRVHSLNDPYWVSRFVVGMQNDVAIEANINRQNNKITDSQYQEINYLLRYSLSDYRDFNSDQNKFENIEANRSLYSSLWNVVIADILNLEYTVENCVNSSLAIISKYKPFFYFLRKEDRDKAIELKKEINSFNDLVRYMNRKPDDIGKIIDWSNVLLDRQREYENTEKECQKFKLSISEDYNYQRFLFKVKSFFALFVIVVTFFLGKYITLKKIRGLKILIENGLSRLDESASELRNPQNVKKETIEHIIKLSSLITTIVAIVGLIINVLGVRSLIILIPVIACIIALLSSILLGIISINNNSPRQRKNSYYLFLFGLFLFIIIIVEIVLIFSLSSFVTALKQSFVTFFTNSTSIYSG